MRSFETIFAGAIQLEKMGGSGGCVLVCCAQLKQPTPEGRVPPRGKTDDMKGDPFYQEARVVSMRAGPELIMN